MNSSLWTDGGVEVSSSDSKKLMGNIKVHLRKLGCLLVELRFPAFSFCIRQRSVKLVYEKKFKKYQKGLVFQKTRAFVLHK